MFLLSTECTDTEVILPNISSPAACHINAGCNTTSCCVEVGILKRSLYAVLFLNPCRYNLKIQLEKLVIDVDLFTYTWGKIICLSYEYS
jgi:hypothetical protein